MLTPAGVDTRCPLQLSSGPENLISTESTVVFDKVLLMPSQGVLSSTEYPLLRSQFSSKFK